MIGELRVVSDPNGMSVFLDRGEDTVRVWNESLDLSVGDVIAIVGFRKSDVPTLWDHQIICKHGLCFVHDDVIRLQTRPIDTTDKS